MNELFHRVTGWTLLDPHALLLALLLAVALLVPRMTPDSTHSFRAAVTAAAVRST